MSLILSSILGLACTAFQAQELEPRQPMDVGAVRAPIYVGNPDFAPRGGYQLKIKLADHIRGRATLNGLQSLNHADLNKLLALAAVEGLQFESLLQTDPALMQEMLDRAARRSGKAQPDLLGMLRVITPTDLPWELERIGQALQDLPQVEYAHIQFLGTPPPGDIAPPTSDHTGSQGYLEADPGLNAEGAWAQGVDGSGVRFSDCEYGWNYAHEEYNDLTIGSESGQTIHPTVYTYGWDDHGTAVLGESIATDNGYGVNGIAPGSTAHTYTEWSVEEGYRRETAIANAIAESSAGDVVLLEMQTVNFGSNYGPAELDPDVYNIVKAGSASGVVVVGAAGNGNENLDSGTYSTYMGWGDSGSILVGAGSPDASHDKLSFSTYGSRVDVHGWGSSVFTTGYGDITYGGDNNQTYTSWFSGTSSASGMVAPVACLVQSRSLALNGVGLDPILVRQILKDTGIPQGAGGNIGPLPDAGSAVAAVGPYTDDPWVDLGLGLAGINGEPIMTPSGPLANGTTYKIDLSNARTLSNAWLVVGLSNQSVPFKGGTLVPTDDLLIGPLQTGFGGVATATGIFPANISAGTKLYFQWWVKDAAGPVGFSASNAYEGTSQ
jgi:hypothetical protein